MSTRHFDFVLGGRNYWFLNSARGWAGFQWWSRRACAQVKLGLVHSMAAPTAGKTVVQGPLVFPKTRAYLGPRCLGGHLMAPPRTARRIVLSVGFTPMCKESGGACSSEPPRQHGRRVGRRQRRALGRLADELDRRGSDRGRVGWAELGGAVVREDPVALHLGVVEARAARDAQVGRGFGGLPQPRDRRRDAVNRAVRGDGAPRCPGAQVPRVRPGVEPAHLAPVGRTGLGVAVDPERRERGDLGVHLELPWPGAVRVLGRRRPDVQAVDVTEAVSRPRRARAMI